MESQEKLMLLSQFICKMPEIQTTLPYLPDFMEFYQWLHRDLAGLLTPETVHKISIKNLVKQMSKHYAGEKGDKLMFLYQRVKGLSMSFLLLWRISLIAVFSLYITLMYYGYVLLVFQAPNFAQDWL